MKVHKTVIPKVENSLTNVVDFFVINLHLVNYIYFACKLYKIIHLVVL